MFFFTAHNGDYWRLLSPGQYEITASTDGFFPLTHSINVTNEPHTLAVRRDFFLSEVMEDEVPQKSQGLVRIQNLMRVLAQ